ncbi:MAG: T9SS type A sorting domain-containing protein [Flavobacteriales bacterium]
MNKKQLLLPFLLASICLFNSSFISSQSIQVNLLEDMCFDDGSAEVVLIDIPEPATISWENESTGDVYTGTNPTNLRDGLYLITVLDAEGETHISSAWIEAEVYWYPSNWPQATAPCPGGTSAVDIEIYIGTPDYDVYVNDVFDGSTSSGTYTTNPLPIGVHDLYVIDANGCRSSYSTQEADSNAVIVEGITDLLYELNYEETSCGVYSVSADLIVESQGPYVNYWSYYHDGEWVEEYAETLDGITSGTSIYYNTTDANGCEMEYYMYLFEPNVLQANGWAIPATCPENNGSIDMTVYGGTTPYDFEWSNGATTEDISGLGYGNYTLTVTDAENCTNQFTKHVGLNSNISVSGVATPPNCEENIPGDINISVSGGVEPYTYSWNTGEEDEDIESSQFGYYYVSVTDAEGCVSGDSFYVPISAPCYSYVSGTTYYDLDGNCDVNGDDFPLNASVWSTNGGYLSYNGYGDNYSRRFLADVEITAQSSGYTLVCPTEDVALEYIPNEQYTNVDFFLQPNEIEDDLSVTLWATNPVPGFNGFGHIGVSNPGTTIQEASVTLDYTTLIDFTNSTPAPAAIDEEAGTITWELGTIFPNSVSVIDINFYTEPSVVLGEEVTFTAEILGVANDITPENNSSESVLEVIGSYDPNDKQVTPSGEGVTNMIDPLTEELVYRVRFQNTGTAPAVNVVIEDVIDVNTLNLQTLEVLSTSHNLTDVMVDEDKVLFAFENIMLPDSTSDVEASQGYINFKINVNQGLPLGTVIENDAAIYFDFNEPIITNTSFVTLNEVNSVLESENATFEVFPNPSQGNFMVNAQENITYLELLDVAGRVVFLASPLSSQIEVVLPSSIEPGIYFVRLINENGSEQVQKIMIRK